MRFEFGPFELDRAKRALYRDGEFVAVTPKALDILLLLVEEAGQVVTREQLLARVWPDAFVEEGSISNNISTLRKVLNPYFDGEGPIATIARRGYRFTAPVRLDQGEAHRAGAIAAPADPRPVSAPPAPEPRPAPRLSYARIAGVIAAAAVVVIAFAAMVRFTQARASPPAGVRRSVAVLAMKNLSGQPDQAWLSTALTETIGAELTASGQFRLVSAESVARMQRELAPPSGIGLTRKQLNEIGGDLGCDLILTGDYLAVGGRIRVDVRLDAAATGEPIASASVTDEERNLLTLVGRAGGDLRTKLGLTAPGSGAIAAARASFPSAPDASRSYFLGLEALRLRDGPRAAELLQQSIAADPDFALAHAALSTTWRLLGYDSRGAAEGKRAAELSGRLSPEDRLGIEAQYAEASFNWPKAIEGYGALWRAYPDNIEYGLKVANAQHVGGHSAEAQQVIEQMRRMPAPDGSDPRIDLVESAVAERAGDVRRALAAAARAADHAVATKATLLLARARLKQGNHLVRLSEPKQGLAFIAEARDLFERLGDTGGVADALRYEGGVLIERGQIAEGERKLAAALELSGPLHYVRLTSEIEMLRSIAARQRGALTLAQVAAERAMAAAREADDGSALARAMGQLGVVVKLEGDYARARALYGESEAILRRLSDAVDADSSANNAGVIDILQGRLAAARPRFERLLEAARKEGIKARMATRLQNLSTIRALQGDFTEAETMVKEECAIDDGLAAKALAASCRLRLALLAVDQGRSADARALLAAIDPALLASTPQPPTDLARLATLQLAVADRVKAASALASADRSLAGRDYIPEQAIPVAIARGRLEAASGQTTAAMATLAKARREAEKFGLMPLAFDARLELARLTGEPDRRHAFAELERDARQSGVAAVLVRLNASRAH